MRPTAGFGTPRPGNVSYARNAGGSAEAIRETPSVMPPAAANFINSGRECVIDYGSFMQPGFLGDQRPARGVSKVVMTAEPKHTLVRSTSIIAVLRSMIAAYGLVRQLGK